MMNYIFKSDSGKFATVRACDQKQAKILAIAYYGHDFLHCKCVAFNNKV